MNNADKRNTSLKIGSSPEPHESYGWVYIVRLYCKVNFRMGSAFNGRKEYHLLVRLSIIKATL